MNELLRAAVEALQSIDNSLRLIALHLNYMSQDARQRDAADTADYHLGNRTETDAGGGMQSNEQTRSAAHLGVRGDE